MAAPRPNLDYAPFMVLTRRQLTPAAGLLALVGLIACPSLAQPSAAPAKPPTPPGRAEVPATSQPSQDQIDKRIERVKQGAAARRARREQRQRDTRRAMRKRLARALGGEPVTPEIKKELQLHGQRTARLRRIRLVAATKGNYDAVVRTDRALARESSRHDRWWRERHQERMAGQPEEQTQ